MKLKCLPLVFAALLAVPSLAAAPRAKAVAKSSTVKAKPASAAKGGAVRKKPSKRRRAVPVVQGEGAATPARPDPVVPKNVPQRAYAADAQSFYLNGERIRVRGAPFIAPDGTELAKERLQKALDGGEIALSERSIDADGNVEAIVRVDGRDVADLLLLEEIRSGHLP